MENGKYSPRRKRPAVMNLGMNKMQHGEQLSFGTEEIENVSSMR